MGKKIETNRKKKKPQSHHTFFQKFPQNEIRSLSSFPIFYLPKLKENIQDHSTKEISLLTAETSIIKRIKRINNVFFKTLNFIFKNYIFC